jgi:hypothetical protein
MKKRKRTRFKRAATRDAALKALADLDALQSVCDRRMAAAKEAGAPKEALYHYTNETALFSILDSSQFRFTTIYQMDDTEELNFGFSVARGSFDEAGKRCKGLARQFFRSLAEDTDRKRIRELIVFYSVSFGRRDSEKQWMKYADTGRGVALGFAPAFFQPDGSDSEKPEELTHCGQVFYGLKDGQARHEKVVVDAAAVIARAQRRGWLKSKEDAVEFCHLLRVTMYTEILWNCVTTKDDTWSYQNEVRLLLLDSLKKPKLTVVNPERRPAWLFEQTAIVTHSVVSAGAWCLAAPPKVRCATSEVLVITACTKFSSIVR